MTEAPSQRGSILSPHGSLGKSGGVPAAPLNPTCHLDQGGGCRAGLNVRITRAPPGPGACLGPPGQSGLVQFANEIGVPPGQIVSLCNLHGHGQNNGGAGGSV
jgi:hypothetical protein